MKNNITSTLFLLILGLTNFGQNDSLEPFNGWTKELCSIGLKNADIDAKQGKYQLIEFGMRITTLKDSEFKVFRDNYLFEKYKIKIFDGGCSLYKAGECYSKKMKEIILIKYGIDFFERVEKEAKTLYNKNIQTKIDTGFIFNFTDSMPQFIGGEKKLFEYLGKNTKYPHHSCVNGTVYCQFVVEKDGSLSNFKIIRSLDKKIDTIVLNAIVSMPNWKPAKINNQPVRCKMVLPFKFVLN